MKRCRLFKITFPTMVERPMHESTITSLLPSFRREIGLECVMTCFASLVVCNFNGITRMCLSYIKYLGYPIWFSKAQRDGFWQETILKLQASLDRHKTRNISVYGRATMVNSLFLAHFCHMLRVTTLPTAFVRKISSMEYQFVCRKILPRLKKSVMHLPKHVDGLGVVEITVQRHILQQRLTVPCRWILLELCNQAHSDICFVTNNQIRMKPTQILLEPSRLKDSLLFKARRNCPKPTLWSTVTAAVRDNDIQFLPSLPIIYLSFPAVPEPLPVTGGGVDLSPY
ncbi:Aa_trans domain-containing protein [Mucor velutinosus]|uniref:Aa_trans domain-containing protein n=1 Tax=Mucor velutinosus TaxID=708070 RepID=A0AAN7HPX6_9FUNG|nr:Aa_trans domain-containing protein [Mucor velutinosus]